MVINFGKCEKNRLRSFCLRGYLAQSKLTKGPGPWTWRPRITGHAPWAFSISLVNSFGVILFGCTSLLTHQLQAKPCRCSRRVASIIECIDLGYASNLMRVLIDLIAPFKLLPRVWGLTHGWNSQQYLLFANPKHVLPPAASR